jgi:hypothetical protein
MPLDQAADRGHARAVSVRHLGGIEERLDGLLLGGVDEPAGVDDDDVGTAGLGLVVPGRPQAPGERVGVGLVLGAAEGLDEEPGARSRPQR